MEIFEGKNAKQFNYIAERYDFRFNLVTSFYEWKSKDKNSWAKYEDRDRNSMLLELMSEDKALNKGDFDTFIESKDMSRDYNPFQEYFKELPKWNKKNDYISDIAETIATENQDKFRKILERYLVGCVDCILNVDNSNDVCLVFQGPQGIGKSRWMRSLLPKHFQEEYFFEGSIDTKNKDDVMYLSQYWFIHLDELETLRSNDISAIKSYITRTRISLRKAYGRYKINLVRRASFLGSVNEDKFLSDITGNRRWLVFKVTNIDYQHKINPDNIWTQAYALWQDKNYRYWFDKAEIKQINEQNEEFRTVSLEEELLIKNFNFNDSNGRGEFLASSDIVMKIGLAMPAIMSKLHNILMGKALSKHAKVKKTSGGYTKYWVEYLGLENEPTTEENKPSNPQSIAIEEDDDLPF